MNVLKIRAECMGSEGYRIHLVPEGKRPSSLASTDTWRAWMHTSCNPVASVPFHGDGPEFTKVLVDRLVAAWNAYTPLKDACEAALDCIHDHHAAGEVVAGKMCRHKSCHDTRVQLNRALKETTND